MRIPEPEAPSFASAKNCNDQDPVRERKVTAVAQKAEIQYVSQFYDYGSDKHKKKKKKVPKDFVPDKKPVKIHTVTLDPVALCGILSAVVLCAALIFGGLSLNAQWREHVALKQYLVQLKTDNSALRHKFSLSYNIEDIRTMADTIGLVPEDEIEVRYVRVTPPEPKPRKDPFENLKWFLKGLFA